MEEPEELAHTVSELATEHDVRVAIVESLTGGLVLSDLAAASGSSAWLRGGVVAYDRHTKHALLGVPDGPVVDETAARAMARTAAEMFAADFALAVTGVGGPDAQDGQAPGTVWIAGVQGDRDHAWQQHFDGNPQEILRAVRIEMLQALCDWLREPTDEPAP